MRKQGHASVQSQTGKWSVVKQWLGRVLLLLILGSFTYVVVLPAYNFSHLMPHQFLRYIGVKYEYVLWMEQHADVFLHCGGAFIITLLLHASVLPCISHPKKRIFYLVIGLCVAAEVAQHLIGRGIETSDLLLGIFGSFMAYLMINEKN